MGMTRTWLLAATLCTGLATAAFAAPAARSETSFTYNGETIAYSVAGNGPAMLLIHGYPLSSALMAHQLDGLSGSFQVITMDLPGFGHSTVTDADQTDATYAGAAQALMTHLGITKAIIGGHSMGGQVTLKLYQEAPNLFAGMILFDTNPAPASIIEQHEWPGFAAMARRMGPASLAPAVVPVMVTGDALVKYPALGTQITNMVASASRLGDTGGANALVSRQDYQPMLGTIAVPALVIEGQDDTVYPVPIAQALKAAIPNAQLLIIPGAAHASMYQKPAAANNAILEWAQTNGLK